MKIKIGRTTQIFFGGALFISIMTAAYQDSGPKKFHSDQEIDVMLKVLTELPVGLNSVFAGSGKCAGCHGHDPIAYASVTEDGTDVNPTDDWRSTMMANSAKDPFWRAKVSHEVSINPGVQEAIEDKCTACHAPLGNFAAEHDGIEHYSMLMLATDTIGRDGVSCGACHQQQIETMGTQFSGELVFNPDTIWGPYVSEEEPFPIFSQAMSSFVGFEPVGNHKISNSETCATCHTLLTETVDLEGNFTGGQFVEQATYHEWVNSAYNNVPEVQQECQGCHMPRLEEPIVIASGYLFLEGRTPYGQHWLTGGNSFMLELLRNNADTLGLSATPEQFDITIDRTLYMLGTQTATVEIEEGEVDGDTARYKVKITNLAGHKFPSGYPSRRSYIEFTATDDNGNIVWQSGGLQPNFEVFGQDPEFEPHYNLITQQDQVQIYEHVMGDVNDDVTTVLLRADHSIKDNRLVPLGFSTSHYAYDTTAVTADALNDPDFNHINGIEGSGTDEISYHIPVTGFDGVLHVSARLMFQTVPPKWNDELFSVSTPQIDFFETMYVAEGADPVQVGIAQVESFVVSAPAWIAIRPGVFPNPTSDGNIVVYGGKDMVREVLVYDGRGKLVDSFMINSLQGNIQLPSQAGTYILELRGEKESRIEKVVRL